MPSTLDADGLASVGFLGRTGPFCSMALPCVTFGLAPTSALSLGCALRSLAERFDGIVQGGRTCHTGRIAVSSGRSARLTSERNQTRCRIAAEDFRKQNTH